MSSPFVAEIKIFAGNFAPRGYAFCSGQLLPISQNTALFSLLGTYYGGDGKSTFALPNLQSSAPLGQGQGQGLSDYFLGQQSGSSSVTLLQTEMPIHTHQVQVIGDVANSGGLPGPQSGLAIANIPTYNAAINTQMAFTGISVVGSSFPHNNMQPYLGLTFIIALQGIFPARG